ncbi:MAG TPA: hypothetical protein VK528_02925 [Flavobacterium sp.]|nr:hypothetical protein [Flavobacterium sp.]
MTKISLLGCGWLGLPLAKTLIEEGYSVNGSTTSEDKLSILKNTGIIPFQIALDADSIQGNIIGFLENSNLLIIDIPPKLRSENSANFVKKIQSLIPFIENSAIAKVLFISSTSVYADDNSVVTEHTIPNPDTESGRQLCEAESLLQQNKNFKTTILRFGGLIGEDRHPIKHLAGKTNLENPKAPINLIHQKDCIGIILKIIETNSWNETFNAVASFHPSRETHYTEKAAGLGLPLPQFSHQKISVGKVIDSQKLQNILNYTFIMPEL